MGIITWLSYWISRKIAERFNFFVWPLHGFHGNVVLQRRFCDLIQEITSNRYARCSSRLQIQHVKKLLCNLYAIKKLNYLVIKNLFSENSLLHQKWMIFGKRKLSARKIELFFSTRKCLLSVNHQKAWLLYLICWIYVLNLGKFKFSKKGSKKGSYSSLCREYRDNQLICI